MTILRCPTCFINGTKQNLAEILPDGSAKILRRKSFNIGVDLPTVMCNVCDTQSTCPSCYSAYAKDHAQDTFADYTIIQGKEFSISCGKCGSMVFYKYPKVVDNPMTREVILRKTFNFYGTFVGGTI